MPTTLTDIHALTEAARDLHSASRMVAPGIDRDERLCRIHAALSCLAPGQPDGWISLAVDTIAEQEMG